jgi:hypothetical protein
MIEITRMMFWGFFTTLKLSKLNFPSTIYADEREVVVTMSATFNIIWSTVVVMIMKMELSSIMNQKEVFLSSSYRIEHNWGEILRPLNRLSLSKGIDMIH